MTFLGDVVARARGLASHLIAPPQLARLAHAADRGALRRFLEEHGYPTAEAVPGGGASADAVIDAAIDRGGRRRLARLDRWLGRRRALFRVVLEAPERRVVRILLRSTAAGERPAVERAGLAPTPALPGRALAMLREAGSLRDLVQRLERIGHVYAPALSRAFDASGSDLLALESALDRAFAERACAGARRGGAHLRAWVAESLDLENAWHALLGGTQSFVAGGRRLDRARHDAVLATREAAERRRLLAEAFAGSPLAAVFADPARGPATLERRALAVRIAAERRVARREPLGPAPILEYALRLRAEQSDLRHVHWGVAQGVAPDELIDELAEAVS